MCGAPSDVSVVGCRALIAPVSYVQWLLGAVGGLSIPCGVRGVKRRTVHIAPATFRTLFERDKIFCAVERGPDGTRSKRPYTPLTPSVFPQFSGKQASRPQRVSSETSFRRPVPNLGLRHP